MTDLTPRQAEILAFITECIQSGMPPTQAQIGKRFGFSSVSAKAHIKALVKKGAIEVIPKSPRGLRLKNNSDG